MPSRFSRARVWRRLALGLVVAVVALIALRAALPDAARRGAERLLSGALNASVAVGDAKLDWRTGEIRLDDLVVRDRGNAELAIAKQLTLDVDWNALSKGVLRADLLELRDPQLLFRFDETGRFNWDRPEEDDGDGESEDPPSLFWIEVAALEISSVDIRLQDASETQLPDTQLRLAGFSLREGVLGRRVRDEPLRWGLASAQTRDWQIDIAPRDEAPIHFDFTADAGPKDPDGDLPLRVRLARAAGVQLRVEGELRPNTLDMSAHATWSGLNSRELFPFAAIAGVQVLQGTSEGDVALELDLGESNARGLRAKGRIVHRELHAEVARAGIDATASIRLPQATLELSELFVSMPLAPADAPEPLRVSLSRVEIEALRIDAALLEAAAQFVRDPDGDAAQDEQLPFDLRIETLSVRRSTLRIHQPGVGEQTFEPIALEAQHLRFPEPDFDRFDLSLRSRGKKSMGLQLLAAQLDSDALHEASLQMPVDFSLDVHAGPERSDGRLPLKIELRRERAVNFAVDGHLRFDPLDLSAQVRWQDLQSPALLALLESNSLHIASGTSQAELELGLKLADVDDRGLHLRGRVTHDDLRVEFERDSDGSTASFELPGATVELDDLYMPMPLARSEPPPPTRVSMSRVEFEAPSLQVSIAPASASATAPTSRDTDAPTLEILIDHFSLRKGVLRVEGDPLGREPQTISAITATAEQLRWPDATAARFELLLGSLGTKPLSISGSRAPDRADVAIDATQVDLLALNPLIVRHSSYSVSHGLLSLRSKFKLRGDDFQAPSVIVAHRLKAHSTSNQFQKTFGISLSAAIPLLSDKGGNIKLDVPVSGNLQRDTQFGIRSVIASALQEAVGNSISVAIAAPVDMLGSVLRRIGEALVLGLGEATFHPGVADLPSDAQAVLSSAATLVKRKNSARLELVPQIVSDDLAALEYEAAKPGALGKLIAGGRAIFGGSRKLDSANDDVLKALSQRRVEAITRYLNDRGLAGRIVPLEWDERVYEGYPRVILRLRLRE